MAAGTTALITGGLGLALGGAQAIGGAKRAREANRELNDYERQSLDNAFKDIPLYTEGIDLMRDENARVSGSLIDSASNAGARTIIGAAPRVAAATNSLNADAAANLDNQNMRRAYAIAGDNARIEGITEDRDIANINALSTAANAGRQDMWSGILGAASGLGAIGRGITPSATNPSAATPYTNTGVAPTGPAQYPSYNAFDFTNSYMPPAGGPNPYPAGYFNFPNSFNGY